MVQFGSASPTRRSRVRTALARVFVCGSRASGGRCPARAVALVEDGDSQSEVDSQDDIEQKDDVFDAAESDRQWSEETGRTFPLELPVFLLSGHQCCEVTIETLEMRVCDLKAQIEERANIPPANQDILCDGAVCKMKNESCLRLHGDFLAQAPHLQLIIAEPQEVRDNIERLQSEVALERSFAAAELGRLGSLAAISSLEGVLADPEWTVRQNAASALGKFGEEAAVCVPLLAQLMRNDADANVRMHATTALQEIGSAAVPELEQALREDVDDMVRIRAAESLGKLKNDVSIPMLEQVAQSDSSSFVRLKAMEAISAIKTPKAIELSQAERMNKLTKQLQMIEVWAILEDEARVGPNPCCGRNRAADRDPGVAPGAGSSCGRGGGNPRPACNRR